MSCLLWYAWYVMSPNLEEGFGSLLQVIMMRLPLYKRAAVTVACCIVLYCVLSVLLAVSVVPEPQDSATIQLEEHPTSLLCRRLLSSEIDSTVNMTVQERAQFHRCQVQQFCRYKEHMMPTTLLEREVYNRQSLIDNTTKTFVCLVPKAGSTSLKMIFLAKNKSFSELAVSINFTTLMQQPETRDQLIPYIVEGLRDYTAERNPSFDTGKAAFRSYFKYVMLRNPLERLYSVYRDKIAGLPLVSFKGQSYNGLRMAVFKYNHRKEYRDWVRTVKLNGSSEVNLSMRTFSDFINYWVTGGIGVRDPHFMPVYQICQVCKVKFDFYGNFKTFQADSKVLAQKLQPTGAVSLEVPGNDYYTRNVSEATSNVYRYQYSVLDIHQRKEILRVLSTELDLYYRLFPEERNCHKGVLNIEDDVIQ